MAGGSDLATRDAVGHGTTTTGIAAGNGRNSVDGKYMGIAPKASIIAVKVTSDGVPAHDDQPAEASFYDGNLVFKGMDFVVAKAAELKMPVVMLPNIGSNGGPTDGTSQFSRKIDEIVGSGIKGVAFLNGPGDEGGAANHAQGTIAPGETASLKVEKARADGIVVDLWYPTIGAGESGLEFTITTPSGESFGPYASVANEGARDSRNNDGDPFTYYHNGRDVDFSLSTSQKRQVWISITGETGTYTIDIKRGDTAPTSTTFQASLNFANYSQSPANGFTTYASSGNIWDGATAFNNISPTNYVLQNAWTDIDGVARVAPAAAGGNRRHLERQ
ncbi:S8 family serine peptidase [Pelagicoccus sp. SDUM812002]|uniref:S8 family serine peptidase n=1 Tax=Pelagicoccus sp. SDUM812002 TaxID=3041266 RepID=UPI00280D141D|nr:S8 family serine peptidase [Pelagicoccus sp. SDUM812002]MDQ8186789.1 S8 family serine peptidase [Pelagicoccus sp. SDUM812002]